MKSRIAGAAILIAIWDITSRLNGAALLPGPVAVSREIVSLCRTWDTWGHLCLTIFRGIAGLMLALIGALVLGVPAGLSRKTMAFFSPLLATMQSCPPIIWISLLLVWLGTGSAVPILVVTVAVFPALFLNIAQGTARLDRRLLEMATIYRFPLRHRLAHIMIPGIMQHAMAALAFAAGTTWKVTATAEFFGSQNGTGSRIYWAYRILDMPALFAWAILVITTGILLDVGVVQWLQEKTNGHV